MGEVVVLPVVWVERHISDGGKARIKRQRTKRFGKEQVHDLVMLHADPETVEMPSDCA